MIKSALVESPYKTLAGTILRTKQMTEFEKYFEIALPDNDPLQYLPGQFVMVMVHGVGEAPISIASSPTRTGSFELVVRRAGAVTGALHRMDSGDVVGIRGPYGNGFPVADLKGKDIIFVGGGCGNIPLHSLINYVLDHRRDFGEVHIVLGCKNPQMRLFVEEVEDWGKRPDVSLKQTVDESDEKWKGHVGLITTLIPGIQCDPDNTFAAVVGPPVMYKFVIQELLKKNIPPGQIILSLERHMKCGVGKCGHCQIGESYCCQDGPVFTFEQIRHEREAL